MNAQLLDGLPLEPDRAAVGLLASADNVKQRRLAGAVRPDQAVDAGLRDGQRDIVERDDATERLAEPRDLKNGRHGPHPWRRTIDATKRPARTRRAARK